MNKTERKAARRKKFLTTPVFERFEIGVFLCIAGGFLDAYTYIVRDGVFANAQTGNIILLAIGLCEGRFFDALKYVVPIAFFAAGVVISEFIVSRQRKNGAKLGNYVTLVFLEAAVLVASSFVPTHAEWNLLANAMVSFVASVQYATFRKIENMPAATSFCTGNLRSATQYLYGAVAEKNREKLFMSLKFWAMIACFALGVAAGYFVSSALGTHAVLCCSAFLVAVGIYLIAAKAIKMKKLRIYGEELRENTGNGL